MAGFAEPDLLPGILDDVTLTHIVPKLPWTTFHVLASVSRSWQRAIQSREVYDARIRSHATETLVVVKHCGDDDDDSSVPGISLYSMREKTFYRLPPVPHLTPISRFSEFLTSHGTLYVIGAGSQCCCSECTYSLPQLEFSSFYRMYMLDLAGQGQWKECCRNVLTRPLEHGPTDPIECGVEMGDAMFKRAGRPCWFLSHWLQYNPIDGLWNMVDSDRYYLTLALDKIPQKWLSVEGKRYYMSRRDNNLDIYHSDVNTERSTLQHTISSENIEYSAPGSATSHPLKEVDALYVLPVNNELLAIARCSWDENTEEKTCFCMIKSTGFGSESREIVWQKVPHQRYFTENDTFAMCPIQL